MKNCYKIQKKIFFKNVFMENKETFVNIYLRNKKLIEKLNENSTDFEEILIKNFTDIVNQINQIIPLQNQRLDFLDKVEKILNSYLKMWTIREFEYKYILDFLELFNKKLFVIINNPELLVIVETIKEEEKILPKAQEIILPITLESVIKKSSRTKSPNYTKTYNSLQEIYEELISERNIDKLGKIFLKFDKENKIIDARNTLKSTIFNIWWMSFNKLLWNIYNNLSSQQKNEVSINELKDENSCTKYNKEILEVFFKNFWYTFIKQTLNDYNEYFFTNQGLKELNSSWMLIDSKNVFLMNLKKTDSYKLKNTYAQSTLQQMYWLFSSEEKQKILWYNWTTLVLWRDRQNQIFKVFFEKYWYNVFISDNLDDIFKYFNSIFWIKDLSKIWVIKDWNIFNLTNIWNLENEKILNLKAKFSLKNMYLLFSQEDKQILNFYNWRSYITDNNLAKQILKIFFEKYWCEVIV